MFLYCTNWLYILLFYGRCHKYFWIPISAPFMPITMSFMNSFRFTNLCCSCFEHLITGFVTDSLMCTIKNNSSSRCNFAIYIRRSTIDNYIATSRNNPWLIIRNFYMGMLLFTSNQCKVFYRWNALIYHFNRTISLFHWYFMSHTIATFSCIARKFRDIKDLIFFWMIFIINFKFITMLCNTI